MGARARAGVVATLWLVVVALSGYEIAPATLLPLVREDLGIGPTAGSWILSVLLLSMALWSVPAGVVLDRFDEHRTLGVAMVGMFGATAWGWWAGTTGAYASLLASRFVGGALLVLVWTASLNLAGASVRAERRATAIGLITTAIPAGFAAGHLGSPAVAGAYGWSATLPAFGLLAVLGWLGFVVASRFVAFDAVETETPSRADLGRVLTSRRVLLVGVLGFVGFSLNLLFNSWFPSFLVEEFDLSLALGGLTTAVFPAVGIVSRAASGPASVRLFDGRRRPVVLLGFLVTAPIVVVIGVVRESLVLVGLLAVAGFATQFGLAILYTYVRELVDQNVAGTALSVLNTVGFFGAFSAPLIAGTILETVGGFLPVFVYAGALAAVGVIVAWIAPEARDDTQ